MTFRSLLNKLDGEILIRIEWGIIELDEGCKNQTLRRIVADDCFEEISEANVARVSLDTELQPNTLVIELEV